MRLPLLLGWSTFVLAAVACSNRTNTQSVLLSSGGGTSSGGTSTSICPAGSERCACFGDGTCDQGLTCVGSLCVVDAGDGSTTTGGTSAVSGSSLTGGASNGGSVGAGGNTAAGGAADAGGTHVQCTVGNETACGVFVCDPLRNTCSTFTRGGTPTCGACISDSQCAGNVQSVPSARCVPLTYAGSNRGNYCLHRVAATTCSAPYTVVINAGSASGAAAEDYCGIDQQTITCEAVLDVGQTCSGDTGCGCTRSITGTANAPCMNPGQGGVCVSNKCTYACSSTSECPTGRTCSTTCN
jgi:hypothetical protein